MQEGEAGEGRVRSKPVPPPTPLLDPKTCLVIMAWVEGRGCGQLEGDVVDAVPQALCRPPLKVCPATPSSG